MCVRTLVGTNFKFTCDLRDGPRWETVPREERSAHDECRCYVRLTAGLSGEGIPLTVGTVMDAFMARQAVVAVSMQTTASYTNQATGTTLRSTQFDAGS